MRTSGVVGVLLGLFGVGCGTHPTAAKDPVAAECVSMAQLLAQLSTQAKAAAVPVRDGCYPRAARLWLALRQRRVLTAAQRVEARSGAANMTAALATLRQDIAANEARIAADRQAAVADGCAPLADDAGAARLLKAYVWRDLGAQAATLTASCQARAPSLRHGAVENFVNTAEMVSLDLAGGGHETVIYSVADKLAGSAL